MFAEALQHWSKFVWQTENLSACDLADDLQIVSFWIFLAGALITALWQRLLQTIDCYIPVAPTGDDFAGYVNNYCWAHGTIPFTASQSLPTDESEWERYDKWKRISEFYSMLSELYTTYTNITREEGSFGLIDRLSIIEISSNNQ